jgi:hypothetical protein
MFPSPTGNETIRSVRALVLVLDRWPVSRFEHEHEHADGKNLGGE